jgi:hypothetical protein
MIPVRFRLVLALLLPINPVWAFDPAAAEILTLRLGMTETEVITHLDTQGVKIARADGALNGRTKDGALRVAFDGDGRVRQIAYTFTGRAPNEAAAVQDAVIERFGAPATGTPLSWCRSLGRDGVCPSDAPRLVFEPGGGGGAIGVLTLAAADRR